MCWSRYERMYDSRSYDNRRPVPMDATPEDAAPAGDFRVSDADRQSVIDQLRHHTGEGRLTLDEFEARLDEVIQAKTGTDLQAALRELPPTPRRAPRPSFRGIPVPLVIVAVVIVLSVASAHPIFWLIIPFGFWWRAGHHRHRGRRRPDDVLTSA